MARENEDVLELIRELRDRWGMLANRYSALDIDEKYVFIEAVTNIQRVQQQLLDMLAGGDYVASGSDGEPPAGGSGITTSITTHGDCGRVVATAVTPVSCDNGRAIATQGYTGEV